jgi:hypothetical protein
VPRGVRVEVQHPRTPRHVNEPVVAQIFTLPTGLTAQESATRAGVAAALQGNARPGKHAADADHLSVAAKYGGYFITHDRILKRSRGTASAITPSRHACHVLRDFRQLRASPQPNCARRHRHE